MNNNIAIKVQNITKIYKLYSKPIKRMKESLNLFGKEYHKKFYALSNVNFEINKGETIGIIGSNGSGKSTILKIITGVLTPTSGKVTVKGKVSAILELGSGFNPELSGRENIYLNASINGMNKLNADKKIKEIINFAEIGDFINQPMKTYSSGMKAKLAFAVSISIDPDILIVDEALSVGDVRFKQKSIRKMKDLINKGNTVLFVSHDLSAVNNFCSKVIWLDNGIIKEYGKSKDILNKYAVHMAHGQEIVPKNQDNKIEINNDDVHWDDISKYENFGEKGAEIIGTLLQINGVNNKIQMLEGGENLILNIKIKANERIYSPGIGLLLRDELGNNIFTINNYMYNIPMKTIQNNMETIFKVKFKFPHIKNGKYFLSIAFTDGTQKEHIQHDWLYDVYIIEVLNNQEAYKVNALVVLDEQDINIDMKIKEK